MIYGKVQMQLIGAWFLFPQLKHIPTSCFSRDNVDIVFHRYFLNDRKNKARKIKQVESFYFRMFCAYTCFVVFLVRFLLFLIEKTNTVFYHFLKN
jgi:hypothetical protein